MEKLDRIFNLKYPIRVSFKKKLVWGKKKLPCMGIYEWDSEKKIHNIILARELVKGVELGNTLAHEYIHAWQCEMGLKLNHGRVFKWWAEYLKKSKYSVSKFQ